MKKRLPFVLAFLLPIGFMYLVYLLVNEPKTDPVKAQIPGEVENGIIKDREIKPKFKWLRPGEKGFILKGELDNRWEDMNLEVVASEVEKIDTERDTLGSWVRNGEYLWMLIELDLDGDWGQRLLVYHEKKDGAHLVRTGFVAGQLGECYLPWKDVMVKSGAYIIVNHTSHGPGYCGLYPAFYHRDGEAIESNFREHTILTWPEDSPYLYESSFTFLDSPALQVKVHERKFKGEPRKLLAERDYVLKYEVKNDTLRQINSSAETEPGWAH